MFFSKKNKGPELPEPFGAGSASEEQAKPPAIQPIKMDEIKKAVTSPMPKPPMPPQRRDGPQAQQIAIPTERMQAPEPEEQEMAEAQPVPTPPQRATPPGMLQPPRMQPPGRPPQNIPPFPKPFTGTEASSPFAQINLEKPPEQTPFFTQKNPERPPAQTPAFQRPERPQPQSRQEPSATFTPINSGKQEPINFERLNPQGRQPLSQYAQLNVGRMPQIRGAVSRSPAAQQQTAAETPESEFPVAKTTVPAKLPPPPRPESPAEAAQPDNSQKKDMIIAASQPEMLRALMELVNKSSTTQIAELLKDNELSLSELVAKTGADEVEVKDVTHRLTCLGFIQEVWYRSASGSHFRKYKLGTTKGNIEFDLLTLKDTMPIEELKAKSTRLVALITTGGRIPKSVLLKALPVNDEEQAEQVIRYTEKFKLPSIRDMLAPETSIPLDPKPPKQEDGKKEEKAPEIVELYYEIDNIQKSLEELE